MNATTDTNIKTLAEKIRELEIDISMRDYKIKILEEKLKERGEGRAED